jgi:hypothetical protein
MMTDPGTIALTAFLFGLIFAGVAFFIGLKVKKKFWPSMEDSLRESLQEVQQKYDSLKDRFHRMRDK